MADELLSAEEFLAELEKKSPNEIQRRHLTIHLPLIWAADRQYYDKKSKEEVSFPSIARMKIWGMKQDQDNLVELFKEHLGGDKEAPKTTRRRRPSGEAKNSTVSAPARRGRPRRTQTEAASAEMVPTAVGTPFDEKLNAIGEILDGHTDKLKAIEAELRGLNEAPPPPSTEEIATAVAEMVLDILEPAGN